jgi:hypothetical protein
VALFFSSLSPYSATRLPGEQLLISATFLRGSSLAPIKVLAIKVTPFCAAWPACLWRVFGSGRLHTQRWRSIQAADVQLLCIDEDRVLLFLRFLRSLLC